MHVVQCHCCSKCPRGAYSQEATKLLLSVNVEVHSDSEKIVHNKAQGEMTWV